MSRNGLAVVTFALRTALAAAALLVLTLAVACSNPVATTGPVHQTEDVAMDGGAEAIDVSDDSADTPPADVSADMAAASDAFKSMCPPCPKDHWCDIGIKACVPKPTACLCAPACTGAMQCLPGGANGRKCQPMTCTGKPSLPGTFWRVTSMKVAPPQVGCDLDGDGKANNSLGTSMVAFLSQMSIYGPSADWTAPRLTWTFSDEAPGATAVTAVATAAVPGSPTCAGDAKDSPCHYQVLPDSFVAGPDGACSARNAWKSCDVVSGTTQCAKVEPDFDFAFFPCLQDYWPPMHKVVFQTMAADAGSPNMSGLLCGVIHKTKLSDLVKTDIDADGDGIKESVSAAFTWEAAEVKVIGLSW